jgi:hypothetical protein
VAASLLLSSSMAAVCRLETIGARHPSAARTVRPGTGLPREALHTVRAVDEAPRTTVPVALGQSFIHASRTTAIERFSA